MFGFTKVLEGLNVKAYQKLPNHSISLSNRCPVNHFGAQGDQKHQSFQSISFHYQTDALGSISELKAPRAPEASLFIMRTMPCGTYWSSRRPGGNQSFQTITLHYKNDALCDTLELKAPRAPEASLFIIKSMACEPFRSSRYQEATRASKTQFFISKSMPCESSRSSRSHQNF